MGDFMTRFDSKEAEMAEIESGLPPQTGEMPRSKTEALLAEAKTNTGRNQEILLEFWEGRAHKGMGYTDFHSFIIDKFDTEVDRKTIYNAVRRAAIAREVLGKISPKCEVVSITNTMAQELAKLPPDRRAAAYETTMRTLSNPNDNTQHNVRVIHKQLKGVVSNMLGKTVQPNFKAPKENAVPTLATLDEIGSAVEIVPPVIGIPVTEPTPEDIFEDEIASLPDEPVTPKFCISIPEDCLEWLKAKSAKRMAQYGPDDEKSTPELYLESIVRYHMREDARPRKR